MQHISIISLLVLLPALTETPCWEEKWGDNWVHPSLEASHTSPRSPKTGRDSLCLFFNLANFWAVSSSLFLQSLLIFSFYFFIVCLLYGVKSPVSLLITVNHDPDISLDISLTKNSTYITFLLLALQPRLLSHNVCLYPLKSWKQFHYDVFKFRICI